MTKGDKYGIYAGDIGKERKRVVLEPMPEDVPLEEPSPEIVPVAEPIPA